MSLTLDGWKGAESLGVLMAVKRGYFNDVGLDVEAITPYSPARPVMYVSEGIDEMGITPEPQVVIAREKNAPVVAVGTLVSRPTTALIWLKGSRIDGVADLKGKRIAVQGVPFEERFIRSILKRAGLSLRDVKLMSVSNELVHALVSGQVDAIFGSPNLAGIELRSQGLKPVVTPVGKLGIPSYAQQVVITSTHLLAREPKKIRDFMVAMRRGTAAAIKDPKAAVDTIEESFESNPESSRKDTEAEISATLPFLSRNGNLSPGQAENLVDWMHDEHLIRLKPPVETWLANP